MTTDAQTQAIPRVSAAMFPVPGAQVATAEPDAEVAAAEPDVNAEAEAKAAEPDVNAEAEGEAAEPDGEVAAAEPSAEVPRGESVQDIYEAGLAKLDALHDRWTAAMAEMREAQVTGGPKEAAA
jgi:hypothetical protein